MAVLLLQLLAPRQTHGRLLALQRAWPAACCVASGGCSPPQWAQAATHPPRPCREQMHMQTLGTCLLPAGATTTYTAWCSVLPVVLQNTRAGSGHMLHDAIMT